MEKGILFEKFDTEVISDKFQKREFVITQDKQAGTYDWQEHLKFQLTQDNCKLLDAFNIGDIVTVDFNLKGRRVEKNDKVYYFNSLDAWKITGEQNEASTTQTVTSKSEDLKPEENDSLPF